MDLKICMMILGAGTSIGAAALSELAPQQGQPGPSGVPSAQPRPANPQPRPNAPTTTIPTPNNPAPTTNPQTPVQPPPAGQPQPGQVQPGQVNPGGVAVPGGVVVTQESANPLDGRYIRPFAFQSPAFEGRFADYSRRLVAMENRLNRNNTELTRRLGEARALTGERQQTAIFDIMQGILKEQAALNQYLVRARTAWTGDVEGSPQLIEDELWASAQQSGVTPGAPTNTVPATTPNGTVPPGGNAPAPTDTIPAKVGSPGTELEFAL